MTVFRFGLWWLEWDKVRHTLVYEQTMKQLQPPFGFRQESHGSRLGPGRSTQSLTVLRQAKALAQGPVIHYGGYRAAVGPAAI